MAIIKDREGLEVFKRLTGKRLRAARVSAGLRPEVAAARLGHKGITQISLAESGDRVPPLHEMKKLALLYGVPMDYLVGIHDDPIADPTETNQGVITAAISESVKDVMGRMATALSEHAGVAIAGHRVDRINLKELCQLGEEATRAMRRMRELNPDFDEDVRGASTLDRVLARMGKIAQEAGERIAREESRTESIDREIRLAEIDDKVQQFCLSLVV